HSTQLLTASRSVGMPFINPTSRASTDPSTCQCGWRQSWEGYHLCVERWTQRGCRLGGLGLRDLWPAEVMDDQLSADSEGHRTMLQRCPEVTVLSPVYMGEQSVPELVDRVRQAVERVTNDYEIILVEDGSPDNSWRSIELACRQDRRVKGI